MRVVFIVNRTKLSASTIAVRLANLARSNGIDADICDTFPVPDSTFDNRDVCCVIGGDGTILSVVSPLARRGIKIFGINLGKLGFLATYTESIDDSTFLSMLNGEGRVVERALLESEYPHGNCMALNEFIIKDSSVDGISRVFVYADGEFLAEYTGDGLIFSTSTGSTAYNLSAGGPLMYPDSRSYVMTPICPHTLSNRSLVCNETSNMRVVCASDESVLIADGRKVATLPRGGEVFFKISDYTLKFIRRENLSHFGVLRNKLGWAEDPRQNMQ